MVMTVALCGDSARIVNEARVNAFAVVALLIGAALIIRRAFTLEATRLRVSRVSRFACAYAVVVHNATISVFATQTRATAQSVNAGLGWSAV